MNWVGRVKRAENIINGCHQHSSDMGKLLGTALGSTNKVVDEDVDGGKAP